MDKTPPAQPPTRHIASEAALTQMENISRYFPVWPAVLPSRDNPVLRPLAVGIDKDLAARMVVPPDTEVADAEAQVRRAVGFLTRSYSYCRSVATPGALRHDIDGEPVGPVTPQQAEHAASRLPGYIKKPKQKLPGAAAVLDHEVIVVKISALKVSLPIQPDQLPQVGETTKTVDLQLDLGDGKPITVQFSGKNYRRALRQIEEMRADGSDVVVLLQGRLVAGQKIEGAGLSVQTRAPKAP